LVTDGGWYTPNGVMTISAGAFFIIGFLIWGLRTWKPQQREEQG
jgi:Na+-transporting NADH:ubiquinone oxidoreductase subunit D